MSRKRPLSVSIIGWYLLITNIFTLLSIPINLVIPNARSIIEATGRSMGFTMIVSLIVGIIGCVSGYTILKGKNWGRMLYLIYYPVNFIIGFILYGFEATYITGIIIYLIILVFLLLPQAAKFFLVNLSESDYKSDDVNENIIIEKENRKEDTPIFRKVVGAFLFCIGLLSFSTIFIVFPVLSQEGEGFIGGFIVLFVVILIMSSVFIVPSIFIWSRKAWRKLFSICFTVCGGMYVIIALSLPLMKLSSEWKTIDSDNKLISNSLLYGYGVIGVIYCIIGGFFIYRNIRRKGIES